MLRERKRRWPVAKSDKVRKKAIECGMQQNRCVQRGSKLIKSEIYLVRGLNHEILERHTRPIKLAKCSELIVDDPSLPMTQSSRDGFRNLNGRPMSQHDGLSEEVSAKVEKRQQAIQSWGVENIGKSIGSKVYVCKHLATIDHSTDILLPTFSTNDHNIDR
jgi:hypothetical protein